MKSTSTFISVLFLLILSSCNSSSLTNEDSLNYNDTVIERESLVSNDCIGNLDLNCTQIGFSNFDGWFSLPEFPGCEIYYEPVVFMCVDGEVTTFVVGDLLILDFPGAINPPIISGGENCEEDFLDAMNEAEMNGTLDAFLIRMRSYAYADIHQTLLDDWLPWVGGTFVEINYLVSSCVINCLRIVEPGNPLSPVRFSKTNCGQECCKRELTYVLNISGGYDLVSSIYSSPETPCEDNGQGCNMNPDLDLGPFNNSICTGQCEILSGF